MSDPFGALALQAIGDLGVHIGNGQWAGSSGNLPVPIKVNTVSGSEVTTGLGPLTATRWQIYDGSTSHPVTAPSGGTAVTPPTMYISRTIKTNDYADSGTIVVNIKSLNNGVAQAVGFSGYIDQQASTDAAVSYNQVVMENVAGTAYTYYGNVSNSAKTCTISNATPAVVTVNAHGLRVNQGVRFNSVGGTLPTGMTAGTLYYVLAAGLATNTFRFSASPAGAAINTSSAGTGTFYVCGAGLIANNAVMINSSNVPIDYDGFGQVLMSALLVQPLGNTRGGNVVRVIGNASGPLSEGFAFDANSIFGTTYLDNSSSLISIDIAGSHSTASIRITENTASYMQYWRRTTGTTANYGVLIDASGTLRYDEAGVAVKMQITKGTPGANKTCLYIQEGATPTLRQVRTFDPGAAGINFTAGQLVAVLV